MIATAEVFLIAAVRCRTGRVGIGVIVVVGRCEAEAGRAAVGVVLEDAKPGELPLK